MRPRRHLFAVSLTAMFLAAVPVWLPDVPPPVSEEAPTADLEPEGGDNVIRRSPRAGNPVASKVPARAPEGVASRQHAGDGVGQTSLPQDELVVWGIVHTALGEVVEGESVEMYSPSLVVKHVAVSDEQGQFTFDGVKAAPDYELSVSPEGMYNRYHHRGVKVDLGDTALRVVLEPLRTGLLRGEILNAQGHPVPDFNIFLRSLSKDLGLRRARSDEVGRFEVEDFPEGPFEAVSGNTLLRITGLHFDADANHVTTLVVDSGPHSLTGQVFDDQGQPVVGAIILLNWTHSEDDGARSVVERRTLTDSFGSFSLDGLGEGQHDFVLSDTYSYSTSLRRHMNIGVELSELVLHLDSDGLETTR